MRQYVDKTVASNDLRLKIVREIIFDTFVLVAIKTIVPRFNSKFLKNCISYRGAMLWNAVSTYFTGQFTDFYRKMKKDFYFKELDFSAQSAQSLPRHHQDFKCFWIFYISCLNCCSQLFTCKYANSFEHFTFLETDWIFSLFYFLPW